MQILGFILAALVGITLGLIGSGGSILMVPILVYIFQINPVLATSYSLFIVGITSLIGAINAYRNGLLSIKTAVLFGLTSIVTVFLTRKWVLPLIPENLFIIQGFQITKSGAILLLFAILMLLASLAMIKNNTVAAQIKDDQPKKLSLSILLPYGVLIGLVTGFLGAGGGFLIIPVLVVVFRIPMKTAIGTSLLIIALNSLIGFSGDLGHFNLDWPFLIILTFMATLGIFAGGLLSRSIDGAKLKSTFGWFVLVMAIFILIRELFFLI